jgi:hypothetical protein
MNDEQKSTRLGDLLVERGIITRVQLAHAVELQEIRRQHAIQINIPSGYTQQLGELLIELGFINPTQLKSSLSWQKRLRKTTAMMVFVAPLFTAACGGGGGTNQTNAQSPTPGSQAVSSESVINKPPSSSITVDPGEEVSSKSSSSVISSSSLRPVLISSSSSQASSISSVSSSASIVSGPVYFRWTPPKQRENGIFLDITEIGGYELRYKRKSDSHYKSIIINNSYIDAYSFENLQGEYEFEIAAFDILGLYSIFVKLKPM